ncbi:general stress protein gls20 [Loigolactobacillus rennini DSM 20253]|uniref:Stress response regulator gls24 homolog n=3 Tax=Loigolactobacillus rennini TaxID=238013 RepID=A0A0R2DHV1_9LACO|nr:general stress protein gls20 [Loigolactobacillus rennini DSM 20253]SFZ87196.1 General stress protein, Gls24 family [Loigolactobacillus rennini]
MKDLKTPTPPKPLKTPTSSQTTGTLAAPQTPSTFKSDQHKGANTMTNQNSAAKQIKGQLTYEDKAIQKIVGLAISNIDDLLTVDGGFFSNITDKLVNSSDVTTGINVEVGKKQIAVDLDIVAAYGVDISDLYDQIKTAIDKDIKKMTDLEVVEVNVTVVDVKTKEEYQSDSVTLQDRVSHATDKTKDAVSSGMQKTKESVSSGTQKVAAKAEASRVE